MTTSLALTRTQKAAVILVAMGKPAASRLLKFFKQEELRSLIDAARRLRTIPQTDLERIVSEFEAEFTEGAGLMDGGDQIDAMLSETLSPEEVSAIMGGPKPAGASGPAAVWAEFEALDAGAAAALIFAEHPQTAALILSNLSPAAAAAVLAALDKERRGLVIARMMGLSPASPAALRLVETDLGRKLKAGSGAKDASAGQARVASVLNEMDKSVLDAVMRHLEDAGTPGLAGVRAKLFSFDDIALLPQKARVALFDGLSSELVTLALRGAAPELVEAALSALGARTRRMIEAELAQDVAAAAADIARARRTIASTAIRLANGGAFELPSAAAAQGAEAPAAAA
ncbi:MAG TPA: FliG C-terminal domain-containing protein [Mesorhizobium sp.]|jgi:flagellar motor switch protein FliG|nr:FliG C-terminal domain-containing protein [Mesorhizobium sp.]